MAAGTLVPPSELLHACSWEPAELGGYGSGIAASRPGEGRPKTARPFARFFSKQSKRGYGDGDAASRIPEAEASALLRRAQDEAFYLRSVATEQAARLQAAAVELERANAAAAAAAAAATAWAQQSNNNVDQNFHSQRQQQRQQYQLYLQQRLNYLEVRHELLIDLWTLRVLDNEVLGQQQLLMQQQQQWGAGG